MFKPLETEGEIVKAIPLAEDLEEGKIRRLFLSAVCYPADTAEVQSRINRISEVRVKVVSEFGRDKYGAGSLPLEAKRGRKGMTHLNWHKMLAALPGWSACSQKCGRAQKKWMR